MLMLAGVVPANLPGILGAAVTALASWAPMLARRYRTRRELRIDPKGLVGTVARWRDRTAPHGEELEAAAVDLEQIETLAGKTALDTNEATALARLADARLRRMFELTVAAPARHGLTLGQAEATIAGDALWISEARRLVERTLEIAETTEANDPLADLRALADAREAAIVELRA